MKSTVETLSPTRVRLAIEVPFDELKPSLQKAYREIGSQVQIPGFRRGKIPAAVIDQRVGAVAHHQLADEAHQSCVAGLGLLPGIDPPQGRMELTGTGRVFYYRKIN